MGQQHLKTGAIAMHRVLHFRLSKLRPTACEVRLQKDKRSARLNVSPRALYPLNDMAHSYKQLTFKDTCMPGERIKTDWDLLSYKDTKKNKQKEGEKSWHWENDI